MSTSGGGGGVSVEPGTLEATGTTFAIDNSADGQGGGVQLLKGSHATFVNDTFSGDGFKFSDTYEGGSAYVAENSSASFTNVTFSGDYALGARFGGADVNADEGAHITFTNTLLGPPIGGEPGELACATFEPGSGVTWTDGGGNLGADGSCHLAPADMERELGLGALGENGGPTLTVPLLEASPAIDFGVSGCPTTDQRGYARVGNCDSGAFEFDGLAPKTSESGGTPPTTTATSAALTVISQNKAEEEAAAAKKHREEEAAVKIEPALGASVKIEKVKVTASSLAVTIKTSQAGAVTITGPGLKKTSKTLSPGTHEVRVALTKAGKAERKHHKKIKLTVSLKTAGTTVSNSKEIEL